MANEPLPSRNGSIELSGSGRRNQPRGAEVRATPDEIDETRDEIRDGIGDEIRDVGGNHSGRDMPIVSCEKPVARRRDRWALWAVIASASSIICSGLALGFVYAMRNGGPLWIVWSIGFALSWLTLLASIVVATVAAARVNILAALEKGGDSRK